MKKAVIMIFILMVTILSAQDMPWVKYDKFAVGTDNSLDIMSWNIQTFPKHEHSVEIAANMILGVAPDVVGLQEIKSAEAFTNLLVKLQELDPQSNWMGHRATTDSWEMNLAYLYKSSVITETKIYEIYADDETYHEPFPRKPLVLEFSFKGEDYFVINNHLKAKVGQENEDRRRAAVKLLKEYIDQNLADQEVLLLGDMNDSIADDEEINVFNLILNDPDNYKFTDMQLAQDPMQDWSYPYWKYRGHLDHILITNELFDEFANPLSTIRVIPIGKMMEGGEDARYQMLTDHRPVVLRLVVE